MKRKWKTLCLHYELKPHFNINSLLSCNKILELCALQVIPRFCMHCNREEISRFNVRCACTFPFDFLQIAIETNICNVFCFSSTNATNYIQLRIVCKFSYFFYCSSLHTKKKCFPFFAFYWRLFIFMVLIRRIIHLISRKTQQNNLNSLNYRLGSTGFTKLKNLKLFPVHIVKGILNFYSK